MSEKDQFILEMIRSTASGQTDRAKDFAIKLAESEKESGNRELHDSILEAYELKRDLPIGLYPLKAKKKLEELDLPPEVSGVINDFLDEQRAKDILMKGGMDPRHKALLIGPPGNGKTVLAGAISLDLGIPSFMVRYDDLISKVPGETSRNLLGLFSYARREPCLLFFDEFDALGRERGNEQETGEMKRVTSTLLVQIDDIPSHVVCLAATNHAQMLDAAIWRRFNIRIELPRPKLTQFKKFILEFSKQKGYEINEEKIDVDIISYRASFENFSDAELFVMNSIRKMLLSRGKYDLEQAMMVSLNEWSSGQKKVLI